MNTRESPNHILVDVDWLTQHLNDSNMRVLDVRADDPRRHTGYQTGHIPGAIALDVGRDFFVYGNGMPDLAAPDQLAETLARRGITNDTRVVIYDESTEQAAAITFWALRTLGHPNTNILNGGWSAWSDHGGAVTRDAPNLAPAHYRTNVNDTARATAEWIQANIDRSDILSLDVRSPREYAMGHLPGAINLPYEFSIDMRTQMLQDAATLRAQLEGAGVTPDKEIVVYCHTGMRASHTYATLQVLGYPRVRNYFGSMADWYEMRGLPID